MKPLALVILSLLSFSIVFAQQDTVTSPGDLNERFKIDQNGGTRYSVPILVPPGTNRLAPALELVYDSQQGNGIFGVGWSITGLPSISRSGRIIAVDGVSGSVEYNKNDRFSFAGHRLINIQGEYGAKSTIYRSERDTWDKFTSIGSQGTGPKSFTMLNKRGDLYEFGGDHNSRSVASESDSSVRVWHLSRVTDLNGNQMEIEYSPDPLGGNGLNDNNTYPVKISYTSNSAHNVQANRFISFVYEKRPDIERVFIGGYPVSTSIRLSAVETYVGDQMVSRYGVSYGMSPASGRSLIQTIRRLSGENLKKGLNPVKVLYQQGNNSFSVAQNWESQFVQKNGWGTPSTPFSLSDVNGDGFLDIVGFGNVGTMVSISDGKSFFSASEWSSEFSSSNNWSSDMPRLLADVNGDGMADIVGFGNTGVSVGLSTGTAFDTDSWPKLPYFGSSQNWSSNTPRQLTDVNGDGLADIVGFGTTGVYVAIASPNGFQDPVKWSSDFTISGNWTSNTPRLLSDVNGDGRADIIGFGNTGVTVGLSTGTAFDTDSWPKLPYFGSSQNWTSNTPRMLADVNNDGLADIIGFGNTTVEVSLSTGKSFAKPESWSQDFTVSKNWTSNTPRMLGDVNGDSYMDVIGIGNSGVQVGLSNGYSFSTTNWEQGGLESLSVSSFGDESQCTRLIGDLNADGLADIVGFGADATLVGLSAGPKSDLADEITRSTGAVYKIEYAPLSDPEMYGSQRGSSSIPARNNEMLPQQQGGIIPIFRSASLLGGLYYAVKSYTVENGSAEGNEYTYAYNQKYYDGQVNLEGRGWQGFQKVVTSKTDSGDQRIMEYLRDFPFTGKLEKLSLVEGGSDQDTLKTATATYKSEQSAQSVIAGQKVVWVYRSSARNIFYSNNKVAHVVGQEYAYDSYGNRTMMRYKNIIDPNTGNSEIPENDLYILATYLNDTSTWRLSYPLFRKVSKSYNPNTISQYNSKQDYNLQKYGYDTSSADLVYKGSWDNVHGKFIGVAYGYDRLGNRTSITQPSGAVYLVSYDSTYHTYPASWTSPENQFGERLREFYSFEPKFGNMTASQDANGNFTLYGYDGFGRRTIQQLSPPESVPLELRNKSIDLKGSTKMYGKPVPDKLLTVEETSYIWKDSVPVIRNENLAQWPQEAKGATVWTETEIDGLGREFRFSNQDPDHGARILTEVSYDSRNKVTRSSLPYFEGEETSGYINTVYDVLGRTIRTTVPFSDNDSSVTTTDYVATNTGFQVMKTQASGTEEASEKTLWYEYFANRSKVSRMKTGGGDTDYIYDLTGRLTGLRGPATQQGNRPQYMYTYDALGRVASQRDPSRGDIGYVYDGYDLLVGIKQANGQLTYSYDSLGRVLAERSSTGITGYAYGQPGVENGRGRLTQASKYDMDSLKENSHHYAYSNQGQVVKDSLRISTPINKSYVTSYTYDPIGRTLLILNPDKGKVNYAYNGLNLVKVSTSNADVSYSGFNALGIPSVAIYGNGIKTEYKYDDYGIIQQIKSTGKSGVIQNESYTWNRLTELVSAKDSIDRTNISFAYKNSRISQSGTASFSYDSAGNITRKDGMDYQYENYRWTEAQNADGLRYRAEYDDMGNMTLKVSGQDSLRMVYDGNGNMVSASSSENGQTKYMYDYRGRRICRMTNAGTGEVYVSPIYSERSEDGSSKSVLSVTGIFGDFAQEEQGNIMYLTGNHQGSTVLITGKEGQVLERIGYSAYGKMTAPDSLGIRSLYTGWSYDKETRLYYMDFRYYDPESGRFNRADDRFGGSLSEQDALNAYAYVLNSPVVYVDMDGHSRSFYAGAITTLVSPFTYLTLRLMMPEADHDDLAMGAQFFGGFTGLMYYLLSPENRERFMRWVRSLKRNKVTDDSIRRNNDRHDEDDPDPDGDEESGPQPTARLGTHVSIISNSNQDQSSNNINANNPANTSQAQDFISAGSMARALPMSVTLKNSLKSGLSSATEKLKSYNMNRASNEEARGYAKAGKGMDEDMAGDAVAETGESASFLDVVTDFFSALALAF
ncbi:FG-GAP-like repeat-containing protein [Fulvitalea axinellae]|uniref:FG-GAP-like repeat-containing protein n=1 Tax=Fulvitalea axinellae TaxID=1182444 RepID=UPI0030CA2C74